MSRKFDQSVPSAAHISAATETTVHLNIERIIRPANICLSFKMC